MSAVVVFGLCFLASTSVNQTDTSDGLCNCLPSQKQGRIYQVIIPDAAPGKVISVTVPGNVTIPIAIPGDIHPEPSSKPDVTISTAHPGHVTKMITSTTSPRPDPDFIVPPYIPNHLSNITIRPHTRRPEPNDSHPPHTGRPDPDFIVPPYIPNHLSIITLRPHTQKPVPDDSHPPKPTSDTEVCYPSVGCFNITDPWISELRPALIPQSPDEIDTKFYFYTRKRPLSPLTIHLNSDLDFAKSKFDSDKTTLVLVESFHDGKRTSWTLDLKDVYLNKVDANVIIVDWSGGSNSVNYFQAVSNTRIVGKQLVILMKHLRKLFGADPQKFHLVCHGLGAHICGYLGKEIRGIGRLTALDPAQPYFEGFPSIVRLDKTDARFVDVIHTNAKPFIPGFGFGMIRPYGDVDFYINGGYDQPGCEAPMDEVFFKPVIAHLKKYPVQILSFWMHCDHLRAPYYFIEAVNETNNCAMYGHVSDMMYPLDTLDELTEKVKPFSKECSEDDCLKMGLDTEKSPLRGIFVVNTNGESPYCKPEESAGSLCGKRKRIMRVISFFSDLKEKIVTSCKNR